MTDTRHWYNIEEGGVLWGMRMLVGAYRLFGRWLFTILLYPVIAYYIAFNRNARKASREYLTRLNAFDSNCQVAPTARNTYKHFINFAHSVLDRISAWTGVLTLEDLVFEHREDLARPLQRGQGVLLIGSHLGCLEVCRAFASLKDDIRLNVLVHTRNAERMNRLLKPLNMDHQLELIEVTNINPGTAVMLNTRIQNGEIVVVVGDRVPVATEANPASAQQASTLTVEFLGAPARFPRGPWVLAHLLKCPVLTLFCIKRDGKYHVHCEPFAERIHLPRANREENMKREVQRYVARLEHYCKVVPLQWYNFYPFWGDSCEPGE